MKVAKVWRKAASASEVPVLEIWESVETFE